MIEQKQLEASIAKAAVDVRANNPLAGSITNTVTIDFVANAQLAVGGSAAMVYLPDEGETLVARRRRRVPEHGHVVPHLRGNHPAYGGSGAGRRQAVGARSGGNRHRQPAHQAAVRAQAA